MKIFNFTEGSIGMYISNDEINTFCLVYKVPNNTNVTINFEVDYDLYKFIYNMNMGFIMEFENVFGEKRNRKIDKTKFIDL